MTTRGYSTEGTGDKLVPFPTGAAAPPIATEIPYDNAASGLSSTTVQAAIDEIAAQLP